MRVVTTQVCWCSKAERTVTRTWLTSLYADDVEIDEDAEAWNSVDEPGGDMDSYRESFEMLDTLPAGFKFPCCGGQGDAEPCQVSRHKVDECKKFHSRLDNDEESTEVTGRSARRDDRDDETRGSDIEEASEDEDAEGEDDDEDDRDVE